MVEVTADGLIIDEYRHLEGEGRNFTKPKYLIWTPSGGLIVLDSQYAYEFDKDKKYVEKRPWWYVERMEYNGAGRYVKLVSKGRFLFRVGPTEDGEHGLLAVDNMSAAAEVRKQRDGLERRQLGRDDKFRQCPAHI